MRSRRRPKVKSRRRRFSLDFLLTAGLIDRIGPELMTADELLELEREQAAIDRENSFMG